MSAVTLIAAGTTSPLLALPSELRLRIFDCLVDHEQEDQRDFGGHDLDNPFCLPLKTIRPPLMLHISPIIRKEYLAHFFSSTTFRIDAPIDRAVEAKEIWDEGGLAEIRFDGEVHSMLDETASAWLSSLPGEERKQIRFRRVMFTPITKHGSPLGFTLEIVFHDKAYHIDMYLGEGWQSIYDMFGEAGMLDRNGLLTNDCKRVLMVPLKIVSLLRVYCCANKNQVLGLVVLKRLASMFAGAEADKGINVVLPNDWLEKLKRPQQVTGGSAVIGGSTKDVRQEDEAVEAVEDVRHPLSEDVPLFEVAEEDKEEDEEEDLAVVNRLPAAEAVRTRSSLLRIRTSHASKYQHGNPPSTGPKLRQRASSRTRPFISTTAASCDDLSDATFLSLLDPSHDNVAPYHQHNTKPPSNQCHGKSKRSKPSLYDFPAEIRLMIYSYLVETEQENLRGFTGRDNPDDETGTCLPIKTVRPPALIRTSRLLREEYLPYFFQHTIFRVDARCDYLAIHYRDPDTGDYQRAFDRPAAEWLASLHRPNGDADYIRFRHLMYVPVLRDNSPLGFRLHIVVDARKHVYKVDMHIFKGWTTPGSILFDGGMQALTMPKHVGWALDTLCRSVRGEVLNLEFMAGLERQFGSEYTLKNPVEHAIVAATSGQSEVVNAVKDMLYSIGSDTFARGVVQGTNHCHSEVIPLLKSSESGMDFNRRYPAVKGDRACDLFHRSYGKGGKHSDGIEANWKSNVRMRQIMLWSKADELDKVDLLSWSNEGWYTFHWF